MSHPLIDAIIQNKWRHRVTGEPANLSMQTIIIGTKLAKQVEAYLSVKGTVDGLVLVADEQTYTVASDVIALLHRRYDIAFEVFDAGVEPDMAAAQRVKSTAAHYDVVLAIGSGTINDIGKYGSYLAGKPYIIYATAPSMNGYCSANASILQDGYRRSFAAHLPMMAFFDVDVLAAAPMRLIQSGFGDTMCRTTAQADWLLSHLLLGTDYDAVPFEWLAELEHSLIMRASQISKRDKQTITLLTHALILSGLGMSLSGGSYPASQGEHMMAHTMDLLCGDHEGERYFHGEHIAVTSLWMSRLQHQMMHMIQTQGLASVIEQSLTRAQVPPQMRKLGLDDAYYQPKQALMQERLSGLTKQEIEHIQQAVLTQVGAVMLPYQMLESALIEAGCPTTAEKIGWQQQQWEQAVRYSCYTRDRFTFLDLGG